VADGEVGDRALARAGRLPSPPLECYGEPVRRMAVPPKAPGPAQRAPKAGARPAFAAGDPVTARNGRPSGHTRLPSYLQGRAGEVVIVHGYWVFPDTHAASGDEAPTWLYGVRFAATDLWPGAEPHEVYADLFEPYLEAVPGDRP
jgi:nitrile hydratase